MTNWLLIAGGVALIGWELIARYGSKISWPSKRSAEKSSRSARIEAVESLEAVLQLCVEQKWDAAAEHTRSAARALYEDRPE